MLFNYLVYYLWFYYNIILYLYNAWNHLTLVQDPPIGGQVVKRVLAVE